MSLLIGCWENLYKQYITWQGKVIWNIFYSKYPEKNSHKPHMRVGGLAGGLDPADS